MCEGPASQRLGIIHPWAVTHHIRSHEKPPNKMKAGRQRPTPSNFRQSYMLKKVRFTKGHL